jgi:hypothetical protein
MRVVFIQQKNGLLALTWRSIVAIAQMIFAELARRVAERLERFGDGDVTRLQADRSGRHADLRQPGAERRLAGDEARSTRRAALFGVVVGEDHTLATDAIDVRRAVAHQTHRIGADIRQPDIIAEDHEDVRLAAATCGRLTLAGTLGIRTSEQRCRGNRSGATEQHGPAVRTRGAWILVSHDISSRLQLQRRIQRKPIWLMPLSII